MGGTAVRSQGFEFSFGSFEMPSLCEYYLSHTGLANPGRLKPLFSYPIEILALCTRFSFEVGGLLLGSGKSVLPLAPPERPPGLSKPEFYALWAEDTVRGYNQMVKLHGFSSPSLRRYRRQKEVLEFMRATWDALLDAYQVVKLRNLKRYGWYDKLNHVHLSGINRFRSQLVFQPLEAAKRLKGIAQANRAWYYGGRKPHGRLLVMKERIDALHSSYLARALPTAPKDPEGLVGLVSRLTSKPVPELPSWRPFVRSYIERWKPSLKTSELYTMPSSNAALGYPRHMGGHSTGAQHIVLLGYALNKMRRQKYVPTEVEDAGSYLELLSDSLHPSSQLRPKEGLDALFRAPWYELEKSLPGCASYLQKYLRSGVAYIMDNIDYLPILPISADEKGLKTRFPTCSLTASNLVQQVLRRVIDHIMVNDPRFSASLGGERDVDLRAELGPWYSQDCSAATDYHTQWLTQTVYEELAEYDIRLRPYTKWFDKLFGVKKLILETVNQDLAPLRLFQAYPRAPLLDDRHSGSVRHREHGHASLILEIWDEWIAFLNARPGVLTTTGQMMGDPTSFPPLMLVSLHCAELSIIEHPYTSHEKGKVFHKYLRRTDVVLKGVGDDALNPRWTSERRVSYDRWLARMGGVISTPKSFWHLTRGIIAEIPHEAGFPLQHLDLSTLVAPPGGSKGHVTWNSQSAALMGDPDIPRLPLRKALWRLSPYYYTWKLAYAMGIPVAAPVAYGGIDIPLWPKVSVTSHVHWLQYLSQQTVIQLVSGLGLGPLGFSQNSFISESSKGWLKDVVREAQRGTPGMPNLLSQCSISDEGMVRVSLSEAYRQALGQIRAAEFYFRAPPEIGFIHTPSVRRCAQRFRRTVLRHKTLEIPMSYPKTVADLERKTSLFFSWSGGFLPSQFGGDSRASFGLEASTVVKVRYKGPHLKAVG